ESVSRSHCIPMGTVTNIKTSVFSQDCFFISCAFMYIHTHTHTFFLSLLNTFSHSHTHTHSGCVIRQRRVPARGHTLTDYTLSHMTCPKSPSPGLMSSYGM